MVPFHLPAGAGVGFKPQHFEAIAAEDPPLAFLEVHAENYMGDGGVPHRQLGWLRERYALSIHGVGLSIGSASGLDPEHLARVARLCDRHAPDGFSEHLAWSSHGTEYLNDLLPLPYTDETLALVARHVDQVQEALGRQILLENPATYLSFAESTWPETAFLGELARRTGCGLLLDVNNVFVSCTNGGTSPLDYLRDFPLDRVGEIHLGGHDAEELPSGPLLIDAHAAPVADPVWALYGAVIARTGPLATLIEWDNEVPAFPELMADAARAAELMARIVPSPAELSDAVA
jgi:uncharacterized protein